MTRLENVIGQVVHMRNMDVSHRPWIYGDQGKIKDDVIVGDILLFLEELKEYEIQMTDEEIKEALSKVHISGYTYNYNSCVDCDFTWSFCKNTEDEIISVMSVHLYGDARGGFSDEFVCKFRDEAEMFYLESVQQLKRIDNRFVASINIFTECFSVFDELKGDEIGDFYEIEKEDLLLAINDKRNKAQ